MVNNKKQLICSNNLIVEIKKKKIIKSLFGVSLFMDLKH